MIRNIARFYLLALIFTFTITLWVGGAGAPYSQVLMLALLSWPLAALIMLAQASYARLHDASAIENQ